MAMDPQDAIGIVEALDGEVTAIHEDGSETILSLNSNIWPEDQIETGEGAAVSLRFVDKTSFSLGEDSRLFIDEYVFDPATKDGKVEIDVLKGMFVFISGEVAQNDYDDMRIDAPAIDTTVGIRGTEGGGNVAEPGQPSMFFRADGIIVISTSGGTVTLDTEGQVAIVTLPENPPDLQEGWSAPSIISVFLDALRVAPIDVVQRLIDGDINLDVDAEVYLRQLQAEVENAPAAPNTSTVIDLVFYDNPIADESRNEALDRILRSFERPDDPVVADDNVDTPNTPPPQQGPGDEPSFLASIKDYRDGVIRDDPSDPEPQPNADPQGSVTISGNPLIGEVLTAANDLFDEDGLGPVSYQWQADGTDLSGEAGDTLVLGDDLAGAVITARAQYTDGRGTLESVLSNSAGPIEIPINLAPVVAASGVQVFTEGDDSTVLDGAVSVGDDSGNLSGATVRVAANFEPGVDQLSFDAVEEVTGNFDGETGVLTLSGVAPVAAYQAVLQSIRFSNASDAPETGTRSIEWQVSDGVQSSAPATTEIEIEAIQRGEGIDGYIEGARAFLDVNGNGQFDEGEPFAITDANGSFEFNSGSDTGSLLLEAGGTDITTGQQIKVNLSSPINSSVISPVTTLIDAFVRTGAFTPESAVALLQGSAALTLNPLTDDPIKHALENPDSNAGVDLHALSVATLAAAQLGASYLVAASAGVYTLAQASAAIYDATAQGLGALSYADVLANASTSLGYTPTASDTANFDTMEGLLDVLAGEAEAVRADDSLSNVEQLTRFAQMTAVIQSGLPGIPIPGAGENQTPLADNPLIADILSTESLASVLLSTELSGTIDGVIFPEFVNLSPVISGGDLPFDSFSFDGLPPEQGHPVAELLAQTDNPDHDFDSEFEGVGLVFESGTLAGSWFFSLDGESWQPIPAAPEPTGFAFVLPIQAEIYYQPAPDEVLDNIVGAQVVSWDGTVGEDGEWVPADPTGGATPFSSNALDIPISLDANNTPPEYTPTDLGPGVEDNAFAFDAADLRAGASDRDDPVDTLSVSNVQLTSGEGELSMTGDGSWLFTPAPDWHGDTSFSFDVSDGEFTVPGSAALAINPHVDAVDDSTSAAEDAGVLIDALANDTFAPGAVITAVSTPGNGTAVINSDGSISYTPMADFNGVDTFDYTVTSIAGNTESATVTVQVNPVADAMDDAGSTPEDTPLDIAVLANDGFATGASVSDASDPAHGDVTINPDNTITYTPDPDYHGPDGFSYTVTASGGATETANVVLNVTPVEDIAGDTAMTDEDVPVDINVLSNDGFEPGATISGITQGEHGSVSINSDGTIQFSPEADFSGEDSFEYSVLNLAGDTETAMVSVVVNPVPDAVDDDNAAADGGSIVEDTSALLDVLANDGFSSPVEIADVTQGENGAVSIVGNAVSYTPDPDYHGPDSFSYSVIVNGLTETADVSVSVEPEIDVVDDTLTTDEDSPINGNVLTNDNFESAAAVTAVTQGTNGSVAFAANGDVTYTPDPDFNGTDSFTYEVTTTPGTTETATVSVTVNPVADVEDDELSTVEDMPVSGNVLSNDGFGPGATLTGVSQPGDGSVTFQADGTVLYSPNPEFHGADSFDYTAVGSDGSAESGTVTIGVAPVEDIADDTAETDENAPVNIPVLNNDAFETGAVVSGVSQPAAGTTSINSDGTVNYAPDEGFNGEDAFTYTVTNANGDQETTNVTVTVIADNVVPVAIDDELVVMEDTATSSVFALQDNDLDADEDELTVLTSGPVITAAGGTVDINGDGTFNYVPPADFNGEDSFDYVVTDGTDSDTGTVAIDVTPVNDPPTANDDSYAAVEDGPLVTGNLRDNDTDIDGGSPLYTVTPVPGLVVYGSGVFNFDPSNAAFQYLPAGEIEVVTTQVVMNDRFGGTDVSELTFNVTGSEDAPIAVNDAAVAFENGQIISGNVLDNDLVMDVGTVIVSAELLSGGRAGFSFNEPDGSWSFDPTAANFEALNAGEEYSFLVRYRATDNTGSTSEANLLIAVLGANDAPIANNDVFTLLENTGLASGTVVTNDFDVDRNSTAEYALVLEPQQIPPQELMLGTDGTFVVNPSSVFQDLPNSIVRNYQYTMEDEWGASDSATLSITFKVENEAPELDFSQKTLEFVIGDDYSKLDPGIVLRDLDEHGIEEITVTIESPEENDSLFYGEGGQGGGGPTFTYNFVQQSEGVPATVAEAQDFLRSVVFYNGSEALEGGQRTITWQVTDDGGDGKTGTGTSFVTVLGFNAAPELAGFTAQAGLRYNIDSGGLEKLNGEVIETEGILLTGLDDATDGLDFYEDPDGSLQQPSYSPTIILQRVVGQEVQAVAEDSFSLQGTSTKVKIEDNVIKTLSGIDVGDVDTSTPGRAVFNFDFDGFAGEYVDQVDIVESFLADLTYDNDNSVSQLDSESPINSIDIHLSILDGNDGDQGSGGEGSADYTIPILIYLAF